MKHVQPSVPRGFFRRLLAGARRRRKARSRLRRGSQFRYEPLETRLLLAADAGLDQDEFAPAVVEAPSLVQQTAAPLTGQDAAEGEAAGPQTLAEFAQALTDRGVRFFGAFWCPHCIRQHELFGAAQDLLPFIEVTAGHPNDFGGQVVLNAVGLGQDLTLNPTGRPVNSFPTWEFPDGERIVGFQNLQTLSEKSGIPLPPDVISIVTNAGNIELQLLPDEAPNTVANFLNYVNPRPGEAQGRLIGTIFHRAAENANGSEFVLQGGGFGPDKLVYAPGEIATQALAQIENNRIPSDPPIPDERTAGDRSNLPGTVSMAKNNLGATSEFFVNENNNSGLDGQGFTVFALDLDYLNADGTVNPESTTNRIASLRDVAVGGSFVFDNVPFIDTLDNQGNIVQSTMVVIQDIVGSGTVRGVKFEDSNDNGVRDAGEAGIGGFVIYSDANNNGALDADELSVTTSADGSYSIVLPDGQHRLREQPVNGFLQTVPSEGEALIVNVPIGGEVTGANFGNFEIPAPDGIDLLPESDSGASDTDNVTNFNNSSASLAPRILVSGAQDQALVRLRVDGVIVAEQVASSDVIFELDGMTQLAQGQRTFSATQQLDGIEGPPVSLSVTIDSQPPQFTSNPPSSAPVGQTFVYNAQTNEEGNPGHSYVLLDPATGNPIAQTNGAPVLNPVTGTLVWNEPVKGDHEFDIRATDGAGNTATQRVSLTITDPPVVRFRMEATRNGQPVSQLDVGDRFTLSVFVSDLRDLTNPSLGGVFAAYLDVIYAAGLATPVGAVQHNTQDFGNAPHGDLGTPGIIDAAGSFSGSLNPRGQGEDLLWSLNFDAIAGGTLNFRGETTTDPNDPGDAGQSPAFETGLYLDNRPVCPTDNGCFGAMEFVNATVTISSNFTLLNPIIGPDEDSPGTVLTVDQLAEFKPGFSGELNIIEAGQPANGQVTVANDGSSLTYIPNPNYFGPDEFTYTISDGSDTAIGDVMVSVQPINDNPTAVDDSFQDPLNGQLFVIPEDNPNNFLPVLDNDLSDPDDPNNETLSVNTVQAMSSQGGTVQRASSGQGILYTPPPNFQGIDTFTYTTRDNRGGVSQPATVTVNVTELNDPPNAANDAFPLNGTPILEDSQNNKLDVLLNDTDLEDDPLTIVSVTQPGSGTVTIVDNGTMLDFTPGPNFFGQASFTYTIQDDAGLQDTATVVVSVTPTNDPPTANDDSGDLFRVTQDTQDNPLPVLQNDTSAPDAAETLTVVSVAGVTQGATVEIVGGQVRYTPPPGFLGTDTFTYTIQDPGGLSDTATVTVEVVEFVPGSLSGFVYIDANNDGVRGASERGLEGIVIELSGTDIFGTVMRTTMTDANGQYQFANLAPGTYTIDEMQPAQDFDGDGIPILDGIDTLGSEGGTIPVNDRFNVTLAEGADGVNYNFGEVKGRRLGGRVFPNGSGELSGLGGLGVRVFALDQNGQAVGDPVRTGTTSVDGGFMFEGLAPSMYLIHLAQPEFLIGVDPMTTVVDDTDSTENHFQQLRRDPTTITYRDFSARSVHGVRFVVEPGAGTHRWYYFDSGWPGVEQFEAQLSADSTTITLELTDQAGNTFVGSLPTSDRRVRLLAQRDGVSYFRLDGSRADFNDVLVQQDGSGEGEADSEGEGAGPAPALTSAQRLSATPSATPSTTTSFAALAIPAFADPAVTTAPQETPRPIQPVIAPPVPVDVQPVESAVTADDPPEGEVARTLLDPAFFSSFSTDLGPTSSPASSQTFVTSGGIDAAAVDTLLGEPPGDNSTQLIEPVATPPEEENLSLLVDLLFGDDAFLDQLAAEF